MPGEVFLDASYAIALSSQRDENHAAARRIARRIREEGPRIVKRVR